MNVKPKLISLISKLNYFRLFYRGALFLAAVTYYILVRVNAIPFFDFGNPWTYAILGFITLSFALEMVDRFIPTVTSSMGSQKQFKRNYKPSGEATPKLQPWHVTFGVALSWIALNSVFGVLYFLNVIDQGILVLIALFFSVCDMICILFFCPFQTWMMHNRCCGSCRIYNWDFSMMFTPLVFIVVAKTDNGYMVNPFALVLVALALALLIEWEITYHVHPERFSDATNESLRCASCKEKLCHHKKQLQRFLAKYHKLFKQSPMEKDQGAEK